MMFIRFTLRIILIIGVLFIVLTIPGKGVLAISQRLDVPGIALPISWTQNHRTILLGKVDSPRELTPLQRQRLQGLRQSRNRDIQAVLDTSQEEQLRRYLRRGEPLETAIDKVKLSHEQREMVKAVGHIYHLKVKALNYPGFE